MCLGAIKHHQGVFAFIALSRVLDFQPDSLHTAASSHPGARLNLLVSMWTVEVTVTGSHLFLPKCLAQI